MNKERDKIDHVQRHLEICRRIYLHLLSEGRLDEVLAEVTALHLKKTI